MSEIAVAYKQEEGTGEIKGRVRRYLADNVLMTAGPGDLADDISFLERNLLDSTGVLELVAFLEDSFAIKVEDQEIVPQNLDSVNLIASYVERKRRGT
jgi:acyl carrier protein